MRNVCRNTDEFPASVTAALLKGRQGTRAATGRSLRIASDKEPSQTKPLDQAGPAAAGNLGLSLTRSEGSRCCGSRFKIEPIISIIRVLQTSSTVTKAAASDIDIIAAALAGYADRRVFHGFSRGPTSGGKAAFTIAWHRGRVFELAFDVRAGTLRLPGLLTGIPA